MAVGSLTIDLDAICENWRALGAASGSRVETSAVVKADAYGLGIEAVGPALRDAGVTTFFVAAAEEGKYLRRALGPMPEICVFSGHMAGDTELIETHALTPMVNSIDQLTRQIEKLPGRPFGVQLDTGMNRLGMEENEWGAVRDLALEAGANLLMSHLACADDPGHPMNREQLAVFSRMTDGCNTRRSLAATGGILLGPDFHFDLTRPGVGLYGGQPFDDARPAVRLSLPVIQIRDVQPGETVGYGGAYQASTPRRIATLSSGYADGLHRAIGARVHAYAVDTPCPMVGRVSMDMVAVDVTDLETDPDTLDILCPAQGVDALADAAQTIGYEILTSLGYRYDRIYTGGSV